MTVEMPEPGFPLSWEVLLVNIKIKRSVAKNVFEGKKGEYLCVAQTRIVNFTGIFLTWDGMETRMVSHNFAICERT